MTRDEIAAQIFLKRLPSTAITDSSRKGFESAAEQAFEIADVFVAHRTKLYATGAEELATLIKNELEKADV